MAVSVSSDRLVATGQQGTGAYVHAFDAARAAPVALPDAAVVEWIGFAPQPDTVLTAGWDHTVQLWNAHSGAPAAKPLVHQADISCFAFSPDGRQLLTGC